MEWLLLGWALLHEGDKYGHVKEKKLKETDWAQPIIFSITSILTLFQ